MFNVAFSGLHPLTHFSSIHIERNLSTAIHEVKSAKGSAAAWAALPVCKSSYSSLTIWNLYKRSFYNSYIFLFSTVTLSPAGSIAGHDCSWGLHHVAELADKE